MRTRSDLAKNNVDEVANGWAEVAAALGRSVRTAQRWAKAGLISVHRSTGTKTSQVYARRAEVGTWKDRNSSPWCAARGAAFAPEALMGGLKDHRYIWGWKAIACLLNLSVSTIQRWEHEAQLPIHRLRIGRRASPYVLEGEISAWIKERTVRPRGAAKVDARLPLLMHSFLDAWPAPIAVLDVSGTIIAVNKGWRVFSRSNGCSDPDFGIGRNYFEVCNSAARVDEATASRLATDLGEFLAGKRGDLKVKYQCESPMGKRDYLLSAMRFEGLTSPSLVLSHSDVTNVL